MAKLEQPTQINAETTKANIHKIITKEELAPQIKLIKVIAPDIAGKAKAGQFVKIGRAHV
jgi:NAD(P)H-flavin reductase